MLSVSGAADPELDCEHGRDDRGSHLEILMAQGRQTWGGTPLEWCSEMVNQEA